jgi:antitoxin (DNA-binding transcriptional repressor) of toxin-antitoxin stability system
MIVTATELANDSKALVDRVVARGEAVQVKRHGKMVVEIRRKVGVSGAELLKRLKAARFSQAEQKELKNAMNAASKVFGYAGRD